MCLIKKNLNYAIVKTFKIDFKIIKPEMKEQKSDIFQTQDVETSRKIYIKNSNQIQPVDFRKAHFGKRKKVKTNQVDLSSIVFRHKVQKLVTTFISKLRVNSIYREPCEDYNSENTKSKIDSYASSYLHHQIKRISQKDGLQIGNFGLILWSLISILQITVMVFMFSIMITFPETQKFKSFVYFRMFSIGIYIMDMILSMSVKRYGNGKNLQKLGEIWSYYVHNQFGIDIASILIFPVDLFFNVQTNIQIFLFCLAIIKQINNLRKFEKFEYLFIDTSSKQHYYGLIKVFLANFAIAHFLSVILNFMAQIDQQPNWYSKINIQNQPWYVKYIWGYYWGTNIMLTVGFGDISATNYYEAFALIFIEAFSCITLAYNISYVGALIGSLKQGEKLKKKKLKIFHQMCKENFISNQTESKVANFIEVEHKIKQQFEYQAHDEVLKGLPVSIQRDFRKQANGSLFQSLGFLNNFLKKGLVRLAEKIERRVYHPEQIIFKRGFVPNFSVLQAGSLGFVCRIRSNLDGQQIERISVGQSQKPKIVTLEFIKNKALNYNIKSNSFSVLFYLSPEQLIQCIRGNDLSYQTYLMLKEKQDEIYEGENHTCSLCKKSCHTKFECSRLHYVPLNRHVIFKHLYKLNNIKQKRASKFRRHKSNNSSLPNWYQTSIIQRRFIQQKFGDDHLKQAEDLCKFYSTKQVNMQELMGKSSIIQLQFMKTKSGFKNWGQRTFSKLEKLFQTKDHMHNDFWEIQSDSATNYKFYFNEGNPDALPVRTRKFKQSSAFII